MNNKPDDRSDNADKIQFSIDHTIKNHRLTEDIISVTEDDKKRSELINKNKRREVAIEGMREEIKEEAAFKAEDQELN